MSTDDSARPAGVAVAAGNGEDCGHLLCVAVDAERARAGALDDWAR